MFLSNYDPHLGGIVNAHGQLYYHIPSLAKSTIARYGGPSSNNIHIIYCEHKVDWLVDCETNADWIIDCELKAENIFNCEPKAYRFIDCEPKAETLLTISPKLEK